MNAVGDAASDEEILVGLVSRRFSCRGYRPDPVPRSIIERIAGIAQRTASWCNAQPWQMHIIGGGALERARQEMPEHARVHEPTPDLDWPNAYEGIYLERRRECGLQLYAATGVKRGDREAGGRQRLQNFRFFGAPHVAIVTTDRLLGIYGAIDCGAYVANFMLAAQANGVASIAQAALAAYPEFWRKRLSLGGDRLIVCGISFGYEDSAHPANRFRTTRASTEDVLRWVD